VQQVNKAHWLFILCLAVIAESIPAFCRQPAVTSAVSTFEPAPWLEDFHQLLRQMSSHYANLDWAIEERRMDLPKLRLKPKLRSSRPALRPTLAALSITLLIPSAMDISN